MGHIQRRLKMEVKEEVVVGPGQAVKRPAKEEDGGWLGRIMPRDEKWAEKEEG